jgi:Helix-turn-helix.
MSSVENKKRLKLAERLLELRTEKGLSQKEAAKIFNLNAVTYLHYEKGQREPPLELLFVFADYFEVSTDYLLGYKDY